MRIRLLAVAASALFAFTLNVTSARADPFAYVANFDTQNVLVIDTATNTVVATVPLGFGPSGVAAAPNGAFVYVTAASQTGTSL